MKWIFQRTRLLVKQPMGEKGKGKGKFNWKDYVAIVIAMLTTTLLPIVVFIIFLIVIVVLLTIF